MGGKRSSKKKALSETNMGFIDIVFRWSLEDIFNDDLYKDQVEKIPVSFQSVDQYSGSFLSPLLEETRAEMRSSMEIIARAPYAKVTYLNKEKSHETLLFDVNVDYWRNMSSGPEKKPYKTLPGDVFVIADVKPETASDLLRLDRSWAFALVTEIQMDDGGGGNSSSTSFKVETLKAIVSKDDKQTSLYVVHVSNVTTNRRIWNALHMKINLKIIKEVLHADQTVDKRCSLCSSEISENLNDIFLKSFLSKLNESQRNSVFACLNKMQCNHKSHTELIWGPPGTGKTKTVSVLLFALLRMKYRTLTCTPTNIAITEVAARVLKLVKEANRTCSVADGQLCSLGDILVFGSKERLKVDYEIEEIFLDYRVDRLSECFGLLGWRHCFTSMITFLEDCVSQYRVFLENERSKEGKGGCEDENEEKECCSKNSCKKGIHKSFLEYARERFAGTVLPLRRCVSILYTHIPKFFFQGSTFQDLETLLGLLDSFKDYLFFDGITSEEVEALFLRSIDDKLLPRNLSDPSHLLCSVRIRCLFVLKALRDSLNELKLPSARNKYSIRRFCFESASLLFSTASSSFKLYKVEMKPLDVVVIDEAAQLKECESAIPLQLPGLVHSILVGDEQQLPATVLSNVSNKADFGRSLFQRLTTLGHSKHLLNIQYRMHPWISCFPNACFYDNNILDAATVKHKSYEKHYLPWPMFGPYSFIHVTGREEQDGVAHSRRNMIEVAVVQRLVQTLFTAWKKLRKRLTVGIISPYSAQVVSIQEKLGRKYEKADGFVVKVKSVDGFQGGEEDIIIISTVRSNHTGAIGFISSSQRTNVALTRAKHCLWIVGDGRTLSERESVWKGLVCDAKARRCFFNADEDKELAKAILDAKKDIGQPDDLLNRDNAILTNARQKVPFSDNSRKSFRKVKSAKTQKSAKNNGTSSRQALGCLDELPSLEEESWNFLEAENIAKLRGDRDRFRELVEALKAVDDIKDQRTITLYTSLRVYLGKFVLIIDAGIKECLQTKPAGGEDFLKDAIGMLNLMKRLHSQLELSKQKLESSVTIIGALGEELHSGWSAMVPFLCQQGYMEKDENHVSKEPSDNCGMKENRCEGEKCSKGEKPASEASVNPKPQDNNKSKKKQEEWSPKSKAEKDENHISEELGDHCGVKECISKGEKCTKGKKPASEASVTPKPQDNNKSKKKQEEWRPKSKAEKDENHISEELGDHCGVKECICKGEKCTKGKKPASEASVNPKPQDNNKSKKKQEEWRPKLKAEKDENHISEEPGDHCGVKESICKGEKCSKGKKPASEATVNPNPKKTINLRKNKKSGGQNRK
ncbi:hypothetical protein HRI_004118300 [Hibiscus trionum]|uniref:Helicase MAGATAMA 3 n=1 Tax=Hibiscus trionum TaxID=183268 RepID=A0A9W7IY63_HIBTR|nr:hypothetical protein HRI_004118300 [Hibiscus trionum]